MTLHRLAVWVIALPVLCLVGCREVSQPALHSTGPLFPVEQQGKWGYITRDGDIAIAPQFDRAFCFYENRALVRRNDRYGFIDTSGTFVIPPKYTAAGSFSEGLAPVRPDSLWGFVNRQGTMVISPRFEMAARGVGAPPDSTDPNRSPQHSAPRFVPPTAPPTYFSENRARMREDGTWGYVDREGTTAITPHFAAARDFRNGLARVRLKSGEMGYVMPNGTRVWPPAD